MSDELDGKTVLVTGAAGGIGSAVAEGLCEAGARVFAVDLHTRKVGVPSLREECWKEYQADVSDAGSVQAMIEACEKRFGPPEVLVNVAAISRPCQVQDMRLDLWRQVITMNLTSVFLCSRAVLPAMTEAGGGSIINFSSVLADIGGKGSAHYAAAKAGVEAFSKSLAREVSALGIRVNVISPGMVDTPMLALMSEQQKKALAGRIPLGRIGRPEDFVKPVILLASDGASYMTGQVIRVDGGMNMA
ncbi:MAG: 3-oxoacyl-ACP reductase FabG [Deltaproteobacteria bacterium]|nr:3-oxoacyl-ACP reductase FabG [Deltaproteobacteria bacterium]